MAYVIQKVDVWVGAVEDKPGGAALKLKALADAGANFEFLIGRRDQPGTGVLFLAPLKGAKQTKAAGEQGFSRASNLYSLRMEGPDKPGLCATVAVALANAGVNLRGMSAAALKNRCILYFAFDSGEATAAAAKALKKQFAK